MKRGFLLNGSGQPLARWKGEKWLSARQLLLSAGFCQVRSHSFLFFFFLLPPALSLSFHPGWAAALCALQKRGQKRGMHCWWRKQCLVDWPGCLFWARSLRGEPDHPRQHPPPCSHYLWNFRSCLVGCAGEDQPARVAMIACCLSLLVSKRRSVKAFSQMRAEGCVPGRSRECV